MVVAAGRVEVESGRMSESRSDAARRAARRRHAIMVEMGRRIGAELTRWRDGVEERRERERCSVDPARWLEASGAALPSIRWLLPPRSPIVARSAREPKEKGRRFASAAGNG